MTTQKRAIWVAHVERGGDTLMKEAFNSVTKQTRIKVKFNENLTKSQLYMHGAQDRNWFLDMFHSITKGDKSRGYIERLRRQMGNYGNGAEV